MSHKKTGSCLCGKCTFSFESENLEVGVCHCAMCRRWSGGVTMGIHIHGPVSFEDESSLQWYKSSEWGMRGFCKECGSNLVWSTQDRAMMVPFAGSLDDDSGVTLNQEIFIDEKPGYYHFSNDTVKKTGAEVFAEFSGE